MICAYRFQSRGARRAFEVIDTKIESVDTEQLPETEESNSPWPTIITVSLLIVTLIFSGATLDAASGQHALKNLITLESFLEILPRLKITAKTNPQEVAENETAENAPSATTSSLFASREKAVRWPKLKLSGFGTSADGSGDFAFINNKRVHPGQLIDEKVLLVEVRADDVIVEYQGETKTLSLQFRD